MIIVYTCIYYIYRYVVWGPLSNFVVWGYMEPSSRFYIDIDV
jgi:hypothetical protein